MRPALLKVVFFMALAAVSALSAMAADKTEPAAPVSEATQACLDCHATATPGIVADWRRSRMSRTSPAQALKKETMERRVSLDPAKPPEGLMDTAVGCAECHTMNPDKHSDTFDHEGNQVHVVVSPADCAACHPVEESEFRENLMSFARKNLVDNSLYMDMVSQINGVSEVKGGRIAATEMREEYSADSCIYCHGTEVKVEGQVTVDKGFGEMTFPKLSGWPNHGVGRYNPDGTKGSCAPCHSRHQFSIAMARSPYACAECHKGPDVPAFKVYEVSKHGGVHFSLKEQQVMESVPWVLTKDINAPTCATCHAALLVDPDGNVIAKRTHRMADRLWIRILGLIYSHPHPKSPDVSVIRSPDGLPLPTSLDMKPASNFLIGPEEQAKRKAAMTAVCLACHSTQWVDGQMNNLEVSIHAADRMVLASTRLMQYAWQNGLAQGPAQGGSPFDEYIERLWMEQWLFFGNSVRFGSAMMGADLGVFEDGRWQLARTLRQMEDWIKLREPAGKAKKK